MTLAEKIKRVAQYRRTDLKRVASDAGIPYNTLRGYVQAASTRIPTAPAGIALAKALDVSFLWLFGPSETWPPPLYQEPPPITIAPWPPSGISWEELALAIRLYVGERTRLGLEKMRAELAAKGIEARYVILDHGLEPPIALSWSEESPSDASKKTGPP